MQQITGGVYTLTGLMAGRVYVLRDVDGLTLVDTSIANAGNKILEQIKREGYQPTDIKRILITHAHPDHVGSLPLLKQQTGAKVFAHAEEKRVIHGEIPVPSRARGMHPPETWVKTSQVDQTLSDGDELPILGGLRVVETPGHAPGHLSFWLVQQRLIITGDALFHVFNRITLPPDFLTVDQSMNRQSVCKILDLQPDSMLFGHGQPLIGNARPKLNNFAKRIKL